MLPLNADVTKCIVIDHLTFSYNTDTDYKNIFNDLCLDFYFNNCYVITGLNGCGKSTLLKLIGGKTLAKYGSINVLNKDPFRDTSLNNDITFINNEWGMRTVAYSGYNLPLQSSMKVKEMMTSVQDMYPERAQELQNILCINLDWRLNSVSEGQRKRIQLYLCLLKPFKICLLDEITVNLDIVIKHQLMQYLKKEVQKRECCVIYVTHIFDGLDEWCDQLVCLGTHGAETFLASSVIPIYPFLVNKLCAESVAYSGSEPEEKHYDIVRHNAGGFAHGVLINHVTES